MPTVQNCVCSLLLFWLKSNTLEPLSNQILKNKANELLKTILYLPHYASLSSKQISKQTMPTVQKCVCSNALFCLKNNIVEFFSTKIFLIKVDESIKTIFYLTHYASLLKTEHTHFSKLCLLKRVVLYKRQSF